jgi:hypothetical protein
MLPSLNVKMEIPVPKSANVHRGMAWVMMWLALAIYVTDEALTGFLAVYNPTVLALRAVVSRQVVEIESRRS